jgi:RNA polymerase sigma-70 factor (ECF subfamily)
MEVTGWAGREGEGPRGEGKRRRRHERLTVACTGDRARVDPTEQARDEELIARAQRGDAVAFRGLVERWHVTIHRWALAHLGDPDEADDVTQQVLVRLHLRLHRFRGAARFSTWLYQVTRNAARDAHRRRSRRARTMDRLERLADPPAAADPLADVERREVIDAARAALARLPERQREVFDLVDLQGYAAHEAAGLLGVSAATARTHLFRARRAVRAAMLGLGIERAEGAT